jgi:uncharacterized membrane protein YfcA
VIAGLGIGAYAVVLAAVTLGALVQGTVGFGSALVAVPFVALVAPDALPGTVIAWGLPMNIAVALRERHGVDRAGVGWATVGRLPGAALGAWVVTAVTAETLSIIAGGVVLLAVASSLLPVAVAPTPTTTTAAGFVSGAMETATSMGGPPLALLYQRAGGAVVRSTLAVNFTLGTLTSLTMLLIAGAVRGSQLLLALALQPGLALGLAASRPVARRLDGGQLRSAVLAVAAVAALTAIVRGV